MRNNRFYLYILEISFSMLLMFTSCSREDSYSSDNGGKDHLLVNLLLDIPGTTSKLRAMSSSNEEKIETINVLVFTKDNSSSSEIFSYLAPVQDYQSIANKNLVVKLKKTSPTQTARLVIVANIDINVRDLQGKTKDEVMELLTFDSAGKWKSVSESDFRALPMWSESDSRTIASDMEFPTFKLLRAVARIDVGLNFTSFINGYESAAGLEGYALKEVYLYRGLNQGYVAPSSSVYTDGSVSGATVPPSASMNDRIDYTELSDATQLVRSIYTVEHLAGDEDTCSALVVGLEHDGRTTYHRINFTDDGNNLIPLLRNHRYVMSIKSVYGIGTDDPYTALISNISNLQLEIIAWDQSNKDIYISGDYYFRIDNRAVEIDYRVSKTANIFVETNLQEEDITLSWEDPSQSDYDVSFDYSTSKLTITAKNKNSEQSNRPQVLHIKAGLIDIAVSVTQRKSSSAYQIICDSVRINGKYVYHVPMDESNTITLTIRGVNEFIVGYEYEIYTNTVEGVTFSAKGVFNSQTENVTLQATGTPINVGTAILPLNTNSSLMSGCSATLDILIPKTKILSISYTYTNYDVYGYAAEGSASKLFLESESNFGPNRSSIVMVNGFERDYICEAGPSGSDTESFYKKDGDHAFIKPDKLSLALQKKPDIIIIGFACSFDKETADLFIDYLNEGGVLILFGQVNPFKITSSSKVFIENLFSDPKIIATQATKSGGLNALPTNIDDDITNGPFGDLRKKNWGNDNSTGGSGNMLLLQNLPTDQIYTYSTYGTGKVLMFRHKKLNLIWVGSGGFLSNNRGSIGATAGNSNTYPFTIDKAPSYSAIANTRYSGGVYNSQLFGNIMSWAMHTACFNGINTK